MFGVTRKTIRNWKRRLKDACTQYGIPKLTLHPKGSQPLAYSYKIRVHIKGSYEGHTYEADIGGFDIIQAIGWR